MAVTMRRLHSSPCRRATKEVKISQEELIPKSLSAFDQFLLEQIHIKSVFQILIKNFPPFDSSEFSVFTL